MGGLVQPVALRATLPIIGYQQRMTTKTEAPDSPAVGIPVDWRVGHHLGRDIRDRSLAAISESFDGY